MTTIGAGADDAIGVAGVDHGDFGWARGDETCGVADAFARRNIAQRNDARAQGEARLERHLAHDFLFFLRRVEGLIVAVENCAGTDHIGEGAGAGGDGAAIGHMHDSGRDAEFLQAIQAGPEQQFLVAGLFGGEIFRRGEVGVGAFELEVRRFFQRMAEGVHFVG